jgi:hypothetical protein
MSTSSLSSSALLVFFSTSAWTAQTTDKEATKRVLRAGSDLSINAAELRKNLMAGSKRADELYKLRNAARSYHYKHTLPWNDEGERMLPSTFFFDYKDTMDGYISRFNILSDDFEKDYPTIRSGVYTYLANLNLEWLYKDSDYPDASSIRKLFAMRCVYSPVPEAGDFRIDAGQRELDQLKAQYEEAFNERLENAMQEPKSKLTKMLKDMSNKLAGREDGAPQRWYDSFLGNAEELADVLRHLNVTGDPELEEARAKFAAAVGGYDMEMIKEEEFSRDTLKGSLDEILADYRW